MTENETALAQAASELCQEDLDWIRQRADQTDSPRKPNSQENSNSSHADNSSQEEGSQEDSSENSSKKRQNVNHQWPDAGAILEADYRGEHYEAEVIEKQKYKSGKAIRILTGPASGEVERSMSGAMLKATEKQREENELGRKGVSNGWKFWQLKEGDNHDATSN